LAVLFLTQAIFHGCLVVDLQNYFRVREGLPPVSNGLLTDRLSSSVFIQTAISYAVGIAAAILAFI